MLSDSAQAAMMIRLTTNRQPWYIRSAKKPTHLILPKRSINLNLCPTQPPNRRNMPFQCHFLTDFWRYSTAPNPTS